MYTGLKELEREWNEPENRPETYKHFKHPINFNLVRSIPSIHPSIPSLQSFFHSFPQPIPITIYYSYHLLLYYLVVVVVVSATPLINRVLLKEENGLQVFQQVASLEPVLDSFQVSNFYLEKINPNQSKYIIFYFYFYIYIYIYLPSLISHLSSIPVLGYVSDRFFHWL